MADITDSNTKEAKFDFKNSNYSIKVFDESGNGFKTDLSNALKTLTQSKDLQYLLFPDKILIAYDSRHNILCFEDFLRRPMTPDTKSILINFLKSKNDNFILHDTYQTMRDEWIASGFAIRGALPDDPIAAAYYNVNQDYAKLPKVNLSNPHLLFNQRQTIKMDDPKQEEIKIETPTQKI